MDSADPTYFPEPPGDELLKELEETMPQGVPNDTGFRRRAEDAVTADSQLDSLEALMAESVGILEAKKQYEADREAKKRGFVGMSKEEVEFCNSRMHAFEMAREWDADRCIAVFVQFVCLECDTGSTVFSRLMEHHQHRRNPTTHRWQTVLESKLEPESVLDVRTVPMCRDCVEKFGLDDPLGEEIPYLEDVLNGSD